MSMRGWRTKDGWWFLYNSEPSFHCPYSIGPAKAKEDERLMSIVNEFAARLGMDPEKLLGRLTGFGGRHGGRARVNGKLTDRCDGCGARMERLGYFVKVERPATPEEETIGDKISMRVFGGEAMKMTKSTHVDTKKEARQWAYDEYDIHRSVLAEEGQG